MADLGAIGIDGNLVEPNSGLTPSHTLKGAVCVDGIYQALGGKDTVEGDPAQPSLRLSAGYWAFRWTVLTGTRTISVKVKQPANLSPRPTLVVKANPEIGVNADATGTAAAGTGWVTIGPVTITPTSDGAVWVELHNNIDGTAVSYWDAISAT